MYTRYGNPSMRRWARKAARGELVCEGEVASYGGIRRKSILLILLTVVLAIATEAALWFTFYKIIAGEANADIIVRGVIIGSVLAGVAGIVMFIGYIVLLFNVRAAKFVGILYSVMQGLFLGAVGSIIDLFMPGITLAALLTTGIVFGMCLLMYNKLQVRMSSRFMMGTLIALLCFVVVEIIRVPILYLVASSTDNVAMILGVQAGVALFCVIFSVITVFWDIQNIDYMVKMGADKKFEWILAFNLATSLIYLYMEILELLVRIFAIFGAKKNS